METMEHQELMANLDSQVKEDNLVKMVSLVNGETLELQDKMVILEEMVIEDKMVHRVILVETDKMVDLENQVPMA